MFRQGSGITMMGSKEKKEKPRNSGLGLVDIVFSWSIADVMNKDYYSNKVKEIPETFDSVGEYFNSFIYPLLEETRADLYCNLTTLSRAPLREVFDVNLDRRYYSISFMDPSSDDTEKRGGVYKPEVGDLMAFTDVRPKSIDDLNRLKMPYVLALVKKTLVKDDDDDPSSIKVLSSKPIEFEERGKLFAVHLMNLTTNMRIWKALRGSTNLKVIGRVLQADNNVSGACSTCSSKMSEGTPHLYQRFGLDNSQLAAVLDCINTKNCQHQNTVKLIWGPPGTGKTKTVASLLFMLFQVKCRTLTCAPTNVAVIGVINRLISLLRPTLKHGCYGLGDIVLFGNGKRMNIKDHEDLYNVFLDNRVSCLNACLSHNTGFKASILYMISLIEDPEALYQKYLKEVQEEDESDDGKQAKNANAMRGKANESKNQSFKASQKTCWRKVISQTEDLKIKDKDAESKVLMHYKKKEKGKLKEEEANGGSCKVDEVEHLGLKGGTQKYRWKVVSPNVEEDIQKGKGKIAETKKMVQNKDLKGFTDSQKDESDDEVKNAGFEGSKDKYWRRVISQTLKENKKKLEKTGQNTRKEKKSVHKNEVKCSNDTKDVMTFEEFFMDKLISLIESLTYCIPGLYTHMPTSFIQEEVVEDMVEAEHMLQALLASFRKVSANGGLKKVLSGIQTAIRGKRNLNGLVLATVECLQKLKLIQQKVCLPDYLRGFEVLKSFCLQSARLLFCTASSSSKLHAEGMSPFELLIVDEAAQLKECESTIPLQLAGLRHAILIGDQKQLPAMVQSKIAQKSGFGRSLFQRLVGLGHPKSLLNVQYRMHPSISLFPNREFYENQIEDGCNVISAGYKKSFLAGCMYGSYSFIDINHGKELFDEKHSKKNLVEFLVSRQRVRVGCISPYKAQVYALQEKLGKIYSTDAKSDFSVNIRSVDGFQGGEEDIIIISTVRCNAMGSIGFLSDHQRTNVALTRARHCLWILGNSATLLHSDSIWKKLVLDAKSRGCFFNAGDDNKLVGAISSSLIDGGRFFELLNSHSVLFRNARWKVCFRDEFAKSMASIKDSDIRKEVVSLLAKLSGGWHKPPQSQTIASIQSYDASGLLLELYNLKGRLKLIWSIDIESNKSRDIQVIVVWGVLTASEIPNLARRSEEIFKNYTVNTLVRCKFRKMEGNLVVPASWPLESGSGSNYDAISETLAGELATISLRDESDQKPTVKNSGIRHWKKKIP